MTLTSNREAISLPDQVSGGNGMESPKLRVLSVSMQLPDVEGSEEATQKMLADLARYARCYYPSLPRVFEHAREGSTLRLIQPHPGGERVRGYLQRLGPIALETSCAVIWRLASELAHALRVFPDLPGWLDMSEARMHLWHRECLLLTLPSFATQPSAGSRGFEGETKLVAGLTRLLGRLIGVDPVNGMPQHLARQLPTEILRLFHAKAEGSIIDDTASPLMEFQKDMLQGLSVLSRRTPGWSLAGHFHVPSRLLPIDDTMPVGTVSAPVEPLRPDHGRVTVPLVQLLMRRRHLGAAEIKTVMKATERALDVMTNQGFCLDPANVHLSFNLNGKPLDKKKDLLDLRLDVCSGLSVQLTPPGDHFDPLRSPVTVLSARRSGEACSLLLHDRRGQLSRLFDILRSGSYVPNGFCADDPAHKVRVAASRRARHLPGEADSPPPTPILELVKNVAPDPQQEPSAIMEEERVTESFESPEINVAEVSALAPAAEPVNMEPANPSSETFMDNSFSQETHPPHARKRLVLTTVGSGGIGKSTIARLLYELADLQNAQGVALYDCDATGNRDFQRISPERIVASPVHEVESMRNMVASSMEKNLVIADLPASCHDVVVRDLNPDMIRELREEDNIEWVPIYPVTGKASSIPAIHQWRNLVFGDAPAVLVIILKDGPVTPDMIEALRLPNDIVVRMPLLDNALAAALDAVGGRWCDVSEGKIGSDQKLFTKPLVRRQLRSKIKEMEAAFEPLITRMKAVCRTTEPQD